MPVINVVINARDTKDGVPDIKYIRKITAKSLPDATSMVCEELKAAVPKCEIIDIEGRVVAN